MYTNTDLLCDGGREPRIEEANSAASALPNFHQLLLNSSGSTNCCACGLVEGYRGITWHSLHACCLSVQGQEVILELLPSTV